MESTTAHRLLSLASLAFSAALVVGLFISYLVTDSQLALAQAADSFLDVFTATVLTVAITVAARPRDENHPFGHHRAEPLGALVTAVVAGVLAIEVARSAITALLMGSTPEVDWRLAALFGGKLVIKGVITLIGWSMMRRGAGPSIGALTIDARNDVLINSVALLGFVGVTRGWGQLDAWLALPTVAWIAWSGYKLASENIRLLMGEAPPLERQAKLLELARSVPGVKAAHDLRAQHIGTKLQVLVHVVVDENLTVKQGHDIGEAVRDKLEDESDVSNVNVHVDIQ